MRINIAVLVLSAIGCIAFVALRQNVNPTLDVDGYFVPLAGGFGISQSRDPGAPPNAPRDENRLSGSTSSRFSTITTYVVTDEIEPTTAPTTGATADMFVHDVREVAVVGPIIVGTMGKKFFIFDTTWSKEPRAHVFANQQSWKRALEHAGIQQIPKMADPISLAKGLPDRAIHPQDYRIMNGQFGWPDYAWGDNVTFLAALLIFLQGLLRHRRNVFVPALLLGVVTAIIADLILGEGGPELIAGLFSLPFFLLIIGFMGRLFRWAGRRLASVRPVVARPPDFTSTV